MTAIASTLALRPGRFDSIAGYLGLEVRRMLRNRRYVLFGVGFPVVLYLLYTGVLQGKNADPDPAWRAFFMVSMATYGAISASLNFGTTIAVERASGWSRQLRVTPLPASAYVLTKLLTAYVLSLPALALVGTAAVVINHVSLAPTTWADLAVSLALGSVPFAALGILIGYVFDAASAQGATAVTYFTLAILGGLWAPISSFPDSIATIGRMLPSYHFADLGWTAVTGQPPSLGDVVSTIGYSLVFFALIAWRYRASEQRANG